jgi:hypothetical protein
MQLLFQFVFAQGRESSMAKYVYLIPLTLL